MFFTLELIQEALKRLESVNPFYGLSYLVFKKNNLPIGSTINFAINAEDKGFLERYYKPAPFSSWYYRVFRTSHKNKRWNNSLYASSGLQAVRTQTFGDAFIHSRNTDTWGWKQDYVQSLKSHLHQGRLIPAFYLAVWLYRKKDWPEQTTAGDIVDSFYAEFNITISERRELFESSTPQDKPLFGFTQVTWEELQVITTTPPDMPQEEGGTLAFLGLNGVGPAKNLEFYPGERLNLFTGDNGLGKTFLLDTAWWSLTGQWPDLQALPRKDAKNASLTFEIAGRSKRQEPTTISYNWQTQSWQSPQDRPTIPGFLIYARVDGSFAVWDPARIERDVSSAPRTLNFTKDQVWKGLEEIISGNQRISSNGLIRDWISWQNNPTESPFEMLRKVLVRLSPDPENPIEPGKPTRLPYDAREIPTITQPYGLVPILHAAAGIQRIIAMAYLVVWAWTEHQTLSEQQRKEPQRRMVVLIDEMEAHLHPRWQRIVLPAILNISEDLSKALQAQFLIATHSPLVMTSSEPFFDPNKDKLFHLDLVINDLFDTEVVLEEIPFTKYGLVDNWLTSEVFELPETRSVEATEAIEQAKRLQLEEAPDITEIKQVSERLKHLLSVDDEFWPLWKYFAEEHGGIV